MNVDQHIDFAKMQTKLDEAHIGFNSEAVYPSVTVDGKPGMIVNGLVQGTPLEWKIDTGAINTFITEDVYYSILPRERPVLERARKKFETADGTTLNVVGTAKMMLTLGSISVYFRVFVGGVKSNLLGQDFMTKFECQWKYQSNQMVINCAHTSDDDQGCLVLSMEDEMIPPKCEAVMKSRVISGTKSKEGILVPLKLFVHTHGLAIAHVLVNSGEGIIYARVFNPGDSEVCVKKNTEIALLTPVKGVKKSLKHGDVTVSNVTSGTGLTELPDFLCNMFREGCENLSTEQASEFKTFLLNHQDTFADPNMPAQRANIGEHRIDLNDETPFKEPVRRVPIFKRDILDSEIEKLKNQGLIEKSTSPWSSPLVLVQKKDNTWRLCVDYRMLKPTQLRMRIRSPELPTI